MSEDQPQPLQPDDAEELELDLTKVENPPEVSTEQDEPKRVPYAVRFEQILAELRVLEQNQNQIMQICYNMIMNLVPEQQQGIYLKEFQRLEMHKLDSPEALRERLGIPKSQPDTEDATAEATE